MVVETAAYQVGGNGVVLGPAGCNFGRAEALAWRDERVELLRRGAQLCRRYVGDAVVRHLAVADKAVGRDDRAPSRSGHVLLDEADRAGVEERQQLVVLRGKCDQGQVIDEGADSAALFFSPPLGPA